MTTLTVVYDEKCQLCQRARDWLLTQPCHVPVRLLAAGSPEARRRFGNLPWLGQELVVANDIGQAWVGPAAFLTCLWATRRYRSWSYRLSRPTLAPMAERFFYLVSKNRKRFGGPVGGDVECSWCDAKEPHAH
ncbi:MAG TPA: DCC1-like thiol-disulfide oxidoreductase family protein [Acidimicrobiia bacterium]|nr:DCC1-like thiol-disulfide oxidoreductase family protein [Acidimicrobiia bacterium]